jgi:hypothetical protein
MQRKEQNSALWIFETTLINGGICRLERKCMEYKISVGDLEPGRHLKIIEQIEKATNNFTKEIYFKKIARHILRREGFTKITEGPSMSEFQGVPFDFIAIKNWVLSLIELKGSAESFNYSKEVQFARLYQVVNELKKRRIRPRPHIFLLQINFKVYPLSNAWRGFL